MKKISMFCPNLQNKEEIIEKIKEVINSNYIVYGEKVEEFEKAFSEKLKVNNVVALNSCTSGIRLGLSLAGVGPGDEVITSPQNCSATNTPILEQFATPIFADIQYETANIDPKDIEHRITNKTKAIIVTHWGGYPCDLDEINQIAKKHNLKVIEDAADAMGATYKGKAIGSISDFTSFSFQAVKHITTSNGGMLSLIDPELKKTAARRSWYGIDRIERKKYISEENCPGYFDFNVKEVGYRYEMTNIQAVMGLHGLKYFDQELQRRINIAKKYDEELSRVPGITLFNYKKDRQSAYGLYCVHVERRTDFYKMMKSKGIETSVVHKRNDSDDVFGGLRKDLPNLDRLSKDIIAIPIHSALIMEDVDYIIDSIKEGW